MTCSEIWKDVVGYEGIYEVSSIGRVRSVDRFVEYSDGRRTFTKGKILRHNINGKYKIRMVHLYDGVKRKAISVHRLVAIAFIANPDNKTDVNHIDGNRENNAVNNLEWTTHLENMQHGFRHGLINNTGTNHGNNVYSEIDIQQVVNLLHQGYGNAEIEKITGVSRATVYQIKAKNQWTHIKPTI